MALDPWTADATDDTEPTDLRQGGVVAQELRVLKTRTNALDAAKAPLASPTFTGTVIARGAAAIGSSTAFGESSQGNPAVTGVENTSYGDHALPFLSAGSGSHNTVLGFSASYSLTDGLANTVLGSAALYAATTQNHNTAIGYKALNACVTDNNTAIGSNAGTALTTGTKNVVVGQSAMSAATTHANSVVLGYKAASGGIDNTVTIGIGAASGGAYSYGASAVHSVVIGPGAAANLAGSQVNNSVIIGAAAGNGASTAAECTLIGTATGRSLTSSSFATMVGNNAGIAQTTGFGAAYFGESAGRYVTTGLRNTCIGAQAGSVESGIGANLITGDDNILLGHLSVPPATSSSGYCVLGSDAIGTLICNDTSISGLSDAKDKDEVEDLAEGLDFINSVRPVKFKWNHRDLSGWQEGDVDDDGELIPEPRKNAKFGMQESGFIAQELLGAQTEAGAEYLRLVDESDPERLTAAYGRLLPSMVKAIQDLSTQLTASQEQLTTQADQIAELQAQVTALLP